MVATKLFALKFGHRAVKTLVGCCGRNMDFKAFKLGRIWPKNEDSSQKIISMMVQAQSHPVKQESF